MEYSSVADVIEWTPEMDLASFLALVSRATDEERERLTFDMDYFFVDKFMGLDESSADQVVKALGRASITFLHLNGMAVPLNVNASHPTRASLRNLARWEQLCNALGSIESLETALCLVEGDDPGSMRCHLELLPRLQHLSSLFVSADDDDAHPTRSLSEVARLVAGLEANPSLKKLDLKVPSYFHATVLPALQCNPAMDMVVLSSLATADNIFVEIPTPDEVQAMADFMRRDLPFAVEFHGYAFSNNYCSSAICNGIAASGAQGISFKGCSLGEDLTLLARSILQSRLQSIAFAGEIS